MHMISSIVFCDCAYVTSSKLIIYVGGWSYGHICCKMVICVVSLYML